MEAKHSRSAPGQGRFAAAAAMLLLASLLVSSERDVGAQTSGTNGEIFYVFDGGASDTVNRAAPGSNGAFASFGSTTDAATTSVDACHNDPNRIVYEQSDGLYEQNVTVGAETKLGGTAAGDANPVWNHDCTQVAFNRGGAGGILVHTRSTNSTAGALSGTTGLAGGGGGIAPEWHPTSSHIFFHGDVDPGAAEVNDIFSVPAAGGIATVEVTTADCGTAGDTATSCQFVSTRPDGAIIAFDRGAGATRRIATAPTSTSGAGARPATVHPDSVDDDKTPDFSPDGLQLVLDPAGAGLSRVNFPANGFRNNFDPTSGGSDLRPDWAKAVGSVSTPSPSPSPTPTGGTPSPSPSPTPAATATATAAASPVTTAVPTATPAPGTGNITGRVTSQSAGFGGFFGFFAIFGFGGSGAPLPVSGATVRLGNGSQTTTNSNGNYVFTNVPAGQQTITVTRSVPSFGGNQTQDCTVVSTGQATATVTVPDQGTVTQDFTCPGSSGGFFGGLFGGFFGLGGLFSFFPFFFG